MKKLGNSGLSLVLGLLLSVMGFQSAQAQDSFNRQKMNSYVQKLEQNDKVMGSVAIDSAGAEVYAKAFGKADGHAADTQTKYRIGSVTKTFTATMIFQLIEEGKLSLSTKLAKFYPDLPRADGITIEDLLRHQSGLYNFTNAEDYPEWMTEPRSREQLLELFRGQDPQFKPGEKTSYSNTNYVLLGYIIEDLTGDSYADQLQQRIVQPLDLQDTYYGDGIDPGQNEARSFQYKDNDWILAPETDMSIPGGAGAIVSTPDDLTDFIRALFQGELVSQESLDHMTDVENGLGMGLMKIPFYDRYAYGHNGGIDGFQSNLSYFPDDDVAFAFTGNGLNYPMNDVLIGMLSIYFGRDFEIPSMEKTKAIALTKEQMQRYAGNYSSEEIALDIEVFIEKGSLMAQATGQPAIPLTATDSTTMKFEQAGLVMKFDSLRSDKYQEFTLHQHGGEYPFKRQ